MQDYDATCLIKKFNDLRATILIDQVRDCVCSRETWLILEKMFVLDIIVFKNSVLATWYD